MSRYSFGYLSSLLFHLYIYGCATALREVRLWVPEAVRSGHAVKLACDYDLEEAALYSIKWYRGDQEFYRYVPKESPPTRVFALPGIHVDISTSDAREVTLLDVQRQLTDFYKCEVSADAPLFHTEIKSAYMTVVEPPISSQMHTAENIESSQKEILVKQSIFSSQVLESQSLSTTVIREEGKHITSRSEQTLQRIEQKSPVQVQIQKFKEVQRKTNESSDSEHQSFVTAINKEESQDSSPSSYSTPTASPKHVRKSVAPRFISPLNGRIVDEGAQVILEGIIDGYPPPTISWTKNNQELISLEGKLHINYDHNRVEVILNDATVQDAGKYTCKAVNDIGSASSTADVVVKKTFLPPIFGRRLQARSVKEGERVVLEVEITGIPDPVVTWYKNGQQILSDVPDCAFRTKVQGNCYSLIIEKVSLDYSGQYLVKAVNSKGEASSMADIFVNKQESQTETIIKVIKEDTKESEIEEIISTFTSEVQKEKRDIKPVPVKPVPLGPPVKQNVRHSLPSPSKFVKGEFRESDYESDYESRIPAKWKPGDSDADEPKYKPVHPLLAQKGFSQSPMFTARTPTPPTEFDNPPEFRAPPRPKFEPIEKPSQSCKTDVIRKSSGHHQKVFKPKPITPKTVPPIIATPDLKSKELEALKPGPSPEMGYAPPPPKTKINIAPFEKTTQIETSKIMNISESTEHMHRVVNVQQTTQVIRFGEKEREESDHQSETFPFKTDLGKHRTKRPVPTVPKKFVPGDFYESEYESDLEAVKIKPKWTPGNSDTEEPHYRKVRPPQITHSTREPIEISSSHPPPVSAESNLAATTNTTQAVSIQKSEVQKKNVSSIQKMRTYKSEQNRESQPIGMEVKRQQDIQLQPGEPPEFCFAGNVASVASYVSSKHMSDMTNTFRSKAQQFATDIMTDVGNSRQKAQPEKIISKQENSKDTESEKVLDDPQAYREESRVSEYGTKHIDPDTGLIYFKYDFGYEFGIVLPNEGKKQEGSTSKYPQIDRKQTGDIEVPVIHEKNTKGNENITSKATETRITPVSTKVPQFKPKKFTHFKAVKWEPASESEMSEAEGDSAKMKKSYCSPQSNLAIQKEPHIHIPTTSQWGPAPTSPLSISLSPSLPSLSPCTGATLDSTASPGGSWQGLSPIKSPRVGYGRGNTPTPPSTPSTPRSSSGLIPQHFCKPPSFITTLRDIAVMKGQPVCFECIVQAEPPPNILWAKDGRLLENSVKHQLHFRNGVCRLTLSQASPEDSGTYTCTATNKLGTVKTSGLLQVPGEKCFMHK